MCRWSGLCMIGRSSGLLERISRRSSPKLVSASLALLALHHGLAAGSRRTAAECLSRHSRAVPAFLRHRLSSQRACMTVLGGRRERQSDVPPPTTGEFAEREKGRKKRRVALVFGYIGTQYYGLQKSENTSCATVESTLEKGLFDSGYIRESNYGNFEKIGWARCSRTDKGVHAARNVISVKLEMKPDDLADSTWSSMAVEDINQCLPEDVRVFSVAKVTQSFRPRDAARFREYRYVLPVSMLAPLDGQPFDEDAAIKHFCSLLRHFTGTRNWHNFTKIRSRDVLRRLKAKLGSSEDKEVVEDDVAAAAVEEEEEGAMQGEAGRSSDWEGGEGQDVEKDGSGRRMVLSSEVRDGVRHFNTAVGLNPLYYYIQQSDDHMEAMKNEPKLLGDPADQITIDLWDLNKHRGALKIIRSNLYQCEGSVLEEGGQKYISIALRGQSFLYNQIRLIVGSAVSVVTGLYPESVLELALESPYLVYTPLAPAEGLYLSRITFGRKAMSPVVLMPEDLGESTDDAAAQKQPPRYALLNNDGAAAATAYEKEVVLSTVTESWTPELVNEWREYSKMYRMDDDVVRALADKLSLWRESMDRMEEVRLEKDRLRREVLAERAGKGRDPKWLNVARTYRSWLPPRFATDCIVRFKLTPGKDVANIQRALALRMSQGKISPSVDTEQLLAMVEAEGVEALVRIGGDLSGEALSDDDDEETPTEGASSVAEKI